MNKEKTIWVLGHKITLLESSGNFDILKGVTPAKTPGPPPHHHSKYDELFFVTEGEMEFILNGKNRIIKKGEMINIPKHSVHTFSNSSEEDCHWINIHSPKGFKEFFEDFGVPEDKENALEESVEKSLLDQIIKACPDYDMILNI